MGGKVNDIGDTIRVVHDGMRSVYFSTHSFVIVMLPDGKETKAIVQHTAKEATGIMQLTANNVSEVMSSCSSNPNPIA
jgi:hypothetical protein